jgi:hypothetical protein
MVPIDGNFRVISTFSVIVDRLETTRFSRSVAILLPRLSGLPCLRVAETTRASAERRD